MKTFILAALLQATVSAPDPTTTNEMAAAVWAPLPGSPTLLYDKSSVKFTAGKVTAWVRRKDQPGMVADDRVEARCPAGTARIVRMRTATHDGKYVWTREATVDQKDQPPKGAAPGVCRIRRT